MNRSKESGMDPDEHRLVYLRLLLSWLETYVLFPRYSTRNFSVKYYTTIARRDINSVDRQKCTK